MGRAYSTEMERLKKTVAFACGADVGPLTALLTDVVSRNLVFVGSGGSFTAATYAAALHEEHTGRIAKALTPLQAASRPSTANTAAILISARGNNPDIIRAFNSLRFKEPIGAICANERSPLLRRISDTGIGLGYGFTVPGGRDGFLATNSLLATLILLIRGYESLFCQKEPDLREIGECPFSPRDSFGSAEDLVRLAKADTIITLSGGWGWPAAIDFESKCSESGISNVLLSDFRNFAHGRHNWLRSRIDTTSILSLEDSAATALAGSILHLVPDDVHKVRLRSEKRGPIATVDLVSHVLHLIGSLGSYLDIDPGRPSVAGFGRKMYRNGFKISNGRTARRTWIARKAEAIGLMPCEDVGFLSDALDHYLARLRRTPIKAVVADYDGTLCQPSERFAGLNERIAEILNNLLKLGLTLGVATGRGGSAHADLRRAISSRHWSRVLVGLYNGATVLRLSDEHTDRTENPTCNMIQVRKALEPLIGHISLEISQNRYQISLRPSTPMNLELLRRSVTELICNIDTPYRVRRSAHSVDVFSAASSKGLLPQALGEFARIENDSILRIGDLGDWGGNDFDLLNEGLSLSVDRVSSRLDSCWNLGLPGSRGVSTTIHYLRALKRIDNSFRIEVSHLRRGLGGRKR